MHHALLYRMHHIIPFSTFHFQTAMNLLFLRLAPVENAHHSSAAAETPLSIRPGGTSFRRAYLTAHSGSVPVRGAESGCLISRDVDLLRQLLRSVSSACSASVTARNSTRYSCVIFDISSASRPASHAVCGGGQGFPVPPGHGISIHGNGEKCCRNTSPLFRKR